MFWRKINFPDSTLLAFGGGTIGDLGGFAASYIIEV